MAYALINNENLTVAVVSSTARAANAWAHFLCGLDDNIILDLSVRRGLSVFTDLELQILYYNLTRSELTVTEYPDKIKSVYETITDLPVNETTADELEKRFQGEGEPFSAEPVVDTPRRWDSQQHGFTATAVKSAPKKQRAASATPSGDKPAKPKGGTTARVWEIATKIKETEFTEGNMLDPSDMKLLRARIIAACEAEGINSSTAGTQYSKWKRDQGFHN